MSTNNPYPYLDVTQDQVDALIRRARMERAQVVRDLILPLFRRKPAAGQAKPEPSLAAATCR